MNNKRMIKSWLIAIVISLIYSLPTWAEVSNKITIKKVAVVEEGTGTWCPWCPRGFVGLDMLNKEFGDNVITIAVHGGRNDEPMFLPEYRPHFSSYPSCMINRGNDIDPYWGSSRDEKPFGIKSDVEAVLAEYVPVGIDVKAEWSDDKKTVINITTTTLFAEDFSNQPYQIGYVLLEDGLTGSGGSWIQGNMYTGSVSNDPNLLPITEASGALSLNYNYVPVAAWETYYGVQGTIPENVVKGKDYTYTFKADITDNTHIQDKTHLTVVALILNKKTGKIINGAKVRLLPYTPVKEAYSVITDNVLTLYYDEKMEQRHGSPCYGCFIFEKEMRSEITHVIIDSSCEKYSPSSLDGLFKGFVNLESIEGMHYLNTSKVGRMYEVFSGCSSLTSLDVSKFNTSNVTNMIGMFSGCSGLTSLDVSKFNTSNVTDMSHMFGGCSGLTSLDVSHFNTSNVTEMRGMFAGCSGLTSLDVSNFDTSKVTVMSVLFSGCSGLTSLDLSSFNTSNVTDMAEMFGSMFYGCSGLTSLDVSKFDTSNVTNMGSMFGCCSGLTSLDVSNFDTSNVTEMGCMFFCCSGLTSLDVSNFDMSKVTGMGAMFYGCSGLTSLDVSNFDTSKVTHMGSMFYGCSGLTSLDVSNFNTSNVTWMQEMFSGCSGLTSLDLSNFDTSNVTHMTWMFLGCSALRTIYCEKAWSCENSNDMFYGCSSLDGAIEYDYNKTDATYANPIDGYFYSPNIIVLRPYTLLSEDNSTLTFYYDGNKRTNGGMSVGPLSYETSVKWYDQRENITTVVFDDSFADCTSISSTAFWFYGCSDLSSISGIEKLNTSNVTDMEYMFYGCSGLTSLDVSKFNTSNVTDMGAMFYGCSGLTSLDVSNFNTSNVTWMQEMFSGCSGLTSLDVSNFNTSNVTSMYCMFYKCSSLTSLDVSKFNTSNVPDMGYMFYGCSGLTSLDVSNFNTSNVTSMYCMFYKCSSLTSLDVSNFNTSNVTNMGYMFSGCYDLRTIFAENDWNTDKVENSDYMFSGCYKLIGGKGTKYNYSYTDCTYARLDGGESAPGYFTVPGLKGDCNGDGTVDKADIVEIENYIMGRPSAKFYEFAADMNNDGVINTVDIVLLVNAIKVNRSN